MARPIRCGELGIIRILEREEPTFAPTDLVPHATPEALAPHRRWLEHRALDPATGLLVMPVMSWVVRTPRHNILIDACLGEGKTCRWHRPWHQLRDLPFLERLRADAGLTPETVDFVVCTHLHGDHVGWNTRLVGDRWVPTFPRARYLMARRELDHWQSHNRSAPPADYEECIDESVLPVIDAGQALLIDEDHTLDEHVTIEMMPGHTPGHLGVRLRSDGAEAVMIGDLMHSPVQCAHPAWHAGSDDDPATAREARRGFLERHADRDVLVLTAHFPSPSAGLIRRDGDAFRFQYLDE
jgi:glyoxylase-like metal-dependent hydrolase (beta-lactamase superfamily II)